ncbi:MAG: hypothetical protein QOH72_2991 [Solirubrobacteraceae bacterium]|jgi:hypothetical protein|nr:hypothetical protein [Solirubrobacteraceae bacterium]
MGHSRPTQRDIADAKKAERRAEMNRAIAEGRLVVRTMTADERAQADARFAAATARGGRRRRTGSR